MGSAVLGFLISSKKSGYCELVVRVFSRMAFQCIPQLFNKSIFKTVSYSTEMCYCCQNISDVTFLNAGEGKWEPKRISNAHTVSYKEFYLFCYA